jgi:hypothetical protein
MGAAAQYQNLIKPNELSEKPEKERQTPKTPGLGRREAGAAPRRSRRARAPPAARAPAAHDRRPAPGTDPTRGDPGARAPRSESNFYK